MSNRKKRKPADLPPFVAEAIAALGLEPVVCNCIAAACDRDEEGTVDGFLFMGAVHCVSCLAANYADLQERGLGEFPCRFCSEQTDQFGSWPVGGSYLSVLLPMCPGCQAAAA